MRAPVKPLHHKGMLSPKEGTDQQPSGVYLKKGLRIRKMIRKTLIIESLRLEKVL